MTLQGTLDLFAPIDVLPFLERTKQTGALVVRGEDVGVIYCSQGEITFAAARPSDGLGEVLVGRGFVSGEDWQRIVAQCQDGQTISGLLFDGAGIDAAELQRALRDHIEEAVFQISQWREGDFQFLADEEHLLGRTCTMTVAQVILGVDQRQAEWAVISGHVPSTSCVVAPVPFLPEDRDEVTITRAEWEVLAVADGRRTIDDLAHATYQSGFAMCRIVHGLAVVGLVEVHDEPVPATAAAIEIPVQHEPLPVPDPIPVVEAPVLPKFIAMGNTASANPEPLRAAEPEWAVEPDQQWEAQPEEEEDEPELDPAALAEAMVAAPAEPAAASFQGEAPWAGLRLRRKSMPASKAGTTSPKSEQAILDRLLSAIDKR